MTRKRKAKFGEAHVRLYAHELACPAYRSLSPDARALLVEFRSLYAGGENRVFMSVREAMSRLGGIGQRRVQSARDELIERGWIRLLEQGAFRRKVRHATVYQLLNEPLEDRDGATAPKDYMRWQPEQKKITVAEMTTLGSRGDYREHAADRQKGPDGSRGSYREGNFSKSTVAKTATQILLPRDHRDRAVLLRAAAWPLVDDSLQRGLLACWALLHTVPLQVAA